MKRNETYFEKRVRTADLGALLTVGRCLSQLIDGRPNAAEGLLWAAETVENEVRSRQLGPGDDACMDAIEASATNRVA